MKWPLVIVPGVVPQFNALPTHGRCEALVAVRIHEGH
jgi:hypothetical protein